MRRSLTGGAALLVFALVALAVPAAAMAALPDDGTATPAGPFAGVAAVTGAANSPIRSAAAFTAMRIVPTHSGRVVAIHFKAKGWRSDGRRVVAESGYGSGSGGVWEMTVRSVAADGTFGNVIANYRQGAKAAMTSAGPGNAKAPVAFNTTANEPFWFVVRNVDANPTRNWASVNLGRTIHGIGDNVTNVLADGPETLHGLDPRSVVWHWGYRNGPQWGTYGSENLDVLPTYVLQYADGTFEGQPLYGAGAYRTTRMDYTTRFDTPITRIAIQNIKGATDVTVAAGGDQVSVSVPAGRQIVALPRALQATAGSTVAVVVSNSGAFYHAYMDAAWSSLFGRTKWENAPNVSDRRIPVWPLP